MTASDEGEVVCYDLDADDPIAHRSVLATEAFQLSDHNSIFPPDIAIDVDPTTPYLTFNLASTCRSDNKYNMNYLIRNDPEVRIIGFISKLLLVESSFNESSNLIVNVLCISGRYLV